MIEQRDDRPCSPSSRDPWRCVVHDSAWDVNAKRCQKSLGLPEPEREDDRG